MNNTGLECDKCHSTDTKVIKEHKKLVLDQFTLEYSEITVLCIKCNKCGHDSIELI